jgi:hypothetical protein
MKLRLIYVKIMKTAMGRYLRRLLRRVGGDARE